MGKPVPLTYDEILTRLTRWAEAAPEVSAALALGSRARADRPADKYSDLDLALFVADPAALLASDGWLESLGRRWASFAEDTLCGGKERRVLLPGARDVDFLLFPAGQAERIAGDGEFRSLIARGYRVLVDKIGLCGSLPPASAQRPAWTAPSPEEFDNDVNDFWFHTVWAAKKLLRGELWSAKSCTDNYLKGHLLRMIEHHAHCAHGPEVDTWHAGRFLDAWAEPWVRAALPGVFARYDREDVARALLATMALYRRLAVGMAERLGYPYPQSADEQAGGWAEQALADLL